MSRFRIKGDPLLSVAKIGLVISEIVLVFTMVVIVVVMGALLTGARARILAQLAAQGAPASSFALVLAYLAVIVAAAFLGLCLVVTLKRIVGSVGDGDPFLPINADRLLRMGWFALAVQGCELLMAALASALGPYAAALGNPHQRISITSHGVSFTGLTLAIVLFILARVFRRGTELREEVEGTV